jgi:hypothetical protein
VEKERPYLVYDLLTKTVEREFLKGIHFLGLNVVHADVFNLFESGGVIMKTADTMGFLVAQHGMPRDLLLNCQPTVTNTAVDFALSVGFKQIYLFGVDLGYKDTEQRHSLHTAYHGELTDDDALDQLLAEMPESDIMVPGNFGGEVATDKILFTAGKMMGNMINRFPAARIFNMSDGAMIKGGTPLTKESFALEGVTASKAEIVEVIKGAFENKQFNLAELELSFLAQIDGYTKDISEIMAQEQKSRSDVIDKLSLIYQYIQSGVNTLNPCALMFRGVLFHLLSMTFNATTIIKDEDEALAKAEFDYSNLIDFMQQARAEIVKHMAEKTVTVTPEAF